MPRSVEEQEEARRQEEGDEAGVEPDWSRYTNEAAAIIVHHDSILRNKRLLFTYMRAAANVCCALRAGCILPSGQCEIQLVRDALKMRRARLVCALWIQVAFCLQEQAERANTRPAVAGPLSAGSHQATSKSGRAAGVHFLNPDARQLYWSSLHLALTGCTCK